MYKLVVLSALLALAAARPGVLAPAVYTSAVVGSVPTTISHQSNSVVHSAALVSPIVHAAPAVVSAYAAPVVPAIAAPVVAAPAVAAFAAPTVYGHGLHY